MAQFETTRWSIVRKAQDPDSGEARKAYVYLCQTYWSPLYAFVRRKGYSHDDARDFTQELLTRIVERRALRGVDPERGRLRTYLLAAMAHLLSDEEERLHAKKRIPQDRIISIDASEAARRYSQLPDAGLTAEQLYDRDWAMTVLRAAFEALRTHYAKNDKSEDFDLYSSYLTTGQDFEPYAELSARTGREVSAIKSGVRRLRARYREEIRRQVADTVASQDEFEVEMNYLLNVFARPSAPP
jgi:RNA polymerase sigma-70 factor (ECF subfamily)